jgi:hypothetical protein
MIYWSQILHFTQGQSTLNSTITLFREKVTDGSLHVRFICSQDQIADILTKPLSSTRFITLKSKLTVNSLSVGLRGRIDDTSEITIQHMTYKKLHSHKHM